VHLHARPQPASPSLFQNLVILSVRERLESGEILIGSVSVRIT